MNQMKQFYLEKVVPALQQKFAYKNVMQIPRLEKIVLNMGVGAASQNRKILDEAADTLTAITGQKAIVTNAKKAVANFHLREGIGIGAKVTLHGDNMWDFLYRFINIDLPRVSSTSTFRVSVTSVVSHAVALMAWVTSPSASRNRRSSLKSISTRFPVLSVWTSLSSLPLRRTTKAVPFSKNLDSPSGSKVIPWQAEE